MSGPVPPGPVAQAPRRYRRWVAGGVFLVAAVAIIAAVLGSRPSKGGQQGEPVMATKTEPQDPYAALVTAATLEPVGPITTLPSAVNGVDVPWGHSQPAKGQSLDGPMEGEGDWETEDYAPAPSGANKLLSGLLGGQVRAIP
jgi:hypothetical protein